MQIIIILLLVVIIIILCPAIFGFAIIATAILIDLLIKLAIPLITLIITLLILTILYKTIKTRSLLLKRLIIYLSVFLVLVVSIILNISEALFLSYLVIFSTIIFYILKCKESKDFITLNILIGLICFLWGFAFSIESNILFGNVIITREIPSTVTYLLLAMPVILTFSLPACLIPYMFSKKCNGPYISRDTKLFIMEHIKLEILFLIIFVIGIVCGVIFLKFLPMLFNEIICQIQTIRFSSI